MVGTDRSVVDVLAAREIVTLRIVGIPRALVHAGQALIAWAVGSAKVEPKGNAVTITKQAAGAAKPEGVSIGARGTHPAGFSGDERALGMAASAYLPRC